MSAVSPHEGEQQDWEKEQEDKENIEEKFRVATTFVSEGLSETVFSS